MPDHDDAFRRLFAPLRQTPDPDDAAVRVVRTAAANRRSVPATRRRRLLLVGATGAAVAATALAAATAVDRRHPGTFVGEASARETLLAAADATRNDPAIDGWRWSQTVYVRRQVLEGRSCPSCAVERAVVESRSVQERWTGPRGEGYSAFRSEQPVAVENEPLLRSVGALKHPRSRSWAGSSIHFPPAEDAADQAAAGQWASTPLSAPQTVPTEPAALVRWVQERVQAQDRAWEEQARDGNGGRVMSLSSMAARISGGLVALATSPQLSGTQKAAAFEALADRPHVAPGELPPTLRSPNRVAVQITRSDDPQGEQRVMPQLQPERRVIVFDRITHRIVAEEVHDGDQRFAGIMQYGEGQQRRSLKMLGGGGAEIRYGEPVAVPGPGQDTEGHQRIDLGEAMRLTRSGQSVDLERKAAAELEQRAQRRTDHPKSASTTK